MNNTFPIDESVARVAESVPPSAELRNSLDVSERLVEGANQSEGLADLPAPERGEAPRTASPDLEQSSTHRHRDPS